MRKHGVCQSGSGRWTSARAVGLRVELRPLAGWIARLGARRMSLGSRLRGPGWSRGRGLGGRGRCGLGLSGHSRVRGGMREKVVLRCDIMKTRKRKKAKRSSWNG